MDAKKRLRTVEKKIEEVLEQNWAPISDAERCKLETILQFCNELLYHGDIADLRPYILNRILDNKAPQLNIQI